MDLGKGSGGRRSRRKPRERGVRTGSPGATLINLVADAVTLIGASSQRPAGDDAGQRSTSTATQMAKECTMGDTGSHPFEASVEKANLVLKEIEEAYGWPKERRQQSYAALRAVLHALRDRLPVEESADLAAQLPMVVRGLYFEGWKPSKVPMKMTREEFLERVRREFGFDVAGGVELLVKRVLDALRRYVTPGEWADIASILPREMADLVPS
jgi:uncharacterized protein (DUF2267 family)